MALYVPSMCCIQGFISSTSITTQMTPWFKHVDGWGNNSKKIVASFFSRSLRGTEQPFTVLLMQIQGQKFKWHLSLTHCHSEATFLWRKPGNTHLRFCTLVLLIVMNNTGAFIAYVIWFECHFLCWLIESRRKGECEVLQRFDYLAALLCNSLSTAVAWLVCVCRFARPLITLICFFQWFGC